MMSTNWCSIIVLTIITLKSVNCDYCKSWSNDISDEAVYQCYENSSNICSPGISNLKIIEINEENGTIDVGFDYEYNCKYTLRLWRWSDISDEINCSINVVNYNDPSKMIYHSKYTYNGIADNADRVQSCTKEATIKVKYVKTGCYLVTLNKDDQDDEFVENTSLEPQYFNISAKNLSFADFQSDHITFGELGHKGKELYFHIKHPFFKKLPNLRLEIESLDKSRICEKCGIFTFSPSSDNSEEENYKYDLCVGTTKSDTDTGISCTVKSDYLYCEFNHLDYGNYSVQYNMINLIQCPNTSPSVLEQCTGRGLESTYSAKSVTQTPRPPTEYNEILFGIIGIGCVGVLLMVALIIHRIRSNRKSNETLESVIIYPDPKPTIGQSKVLLLYANDSDIVMKTMKAFRTALQAEGLEVYDIYDTDQQKLIDEYGEKWVTDKLSDKHIKLVIVETYCGQILLKSSLPAEKLYQNSTCYDCYFPYAVSLIKGKVSANNYTKLFVANIGFDFSKTNCSEFTFLSTSKRFGLPQNFTKLIEELRKECTINICRSDNELEEFKSMYEKMKVCIADPNYLSEVLKVSISQVNDRFAVEETFKKEIITIKN